MNLLAKTYYGLEQVLAQELIELGADNVEISNRAVYFEGDRALLYRANLQLHTAIRILRPLLTFKAKSADDIYDNLRRFNFDEVMKVNSTFIINETVNSETMRNSQFVKYRTKDAIVDFFQEKYNRRPNVSVQNPNIYFDIHVSHDTVTLSLDSSGESLHLRGWRTDQTAAPISEVLAAGMLRMTGWKGECDLIDPMCGSGTILIEAALIALNMAPCIYRRSFGFMNWADFDKELFDEIYDDDSNEREFSHKIYGYDVDATAVAIAERNVKSAGLSKYIEIKRRPIEEFETPAEPAIIVTNPPYGKRIVTDDMFDLYRSLGSAFKHHFAGNIAWVISSDKNLLAAIGMKPSEKIALVNGQLECEFNKYEIFQGKRNDFVRKQHESGERKPKTDREKKEQKEEREERKPRDSRKPKDSRDSRKSKDSKNTRDFRSARDSGKPRNTRNNKEHKDFKKQ